MGRRKSKYNLRKGDVMGTKDPKMKGSGSSNLLGAFDIAKLATDVGGPLLYELFNNKRTNQLREDSKVDFDNVELSQGPVRSLRRRNLGISPRVPTGSTLESQMAEKLFRDAFQTDQENQFEFNDEMFRQQQRDRNLQIGNQEAVINNQIDNQEETVNAGNATRELLGLRLPDRISSIASGFQNVSNDIGQIGMLAGGRKLALARDIITSPENYDDEQVKWAKGYVNGSIGLGKKGKKLTKFS